LNNIPKTIVKEPKEKQDEIEHLPNQQRKMEEIETLDIFPPSGIFIEQCIS
jgi:hypothetical protein